jgi:hypothetical protein
VVQIFTASSNLGHYPTRWKTATILRLKKLGKPGYAVPRACRPTSLLNTLEKVLEAVRATDLSKYAEKYAETYGLLPG